MFHHFINQLTNSAIFLTNNVFAFHPIQHREKQTGLCIMLLLVMLCEPATRDQ